MTRRLAFLAAVSLAVPLLANCDGGPSVDFWDEREFDVNIPAGSPNSMSDTKVVDLNEHAEITGKLKQLKEVTIPEIWLEISNVDASNVATKATGKLEVSENADGATKTTIADYKDLAIANNSKTQLTLAAEPQKTLQDLALNAGTFKAFYSGSLDQVPAKFHVKARIHIQATVGL